MPFNEDEPLPAFGSLRCDENAESKNEITFSKSTSELHRKKDGKNKSNPLPSKTKSKSDTAAIGPTGRCKSVLDNEEAQEENGVLFWVNKSGFPIDDTTWKRMWDHVAKIHPDGNTIVRSVKDEKELARVITPQPPLKFSVTMPVAERIEKIQAYMTELQYNHTGTQFFEIRKNRPISGLMESAKEMIRESLPIKCLEAVILGIFLTNGIMGLERYPISFKTCFKGTYHRHVVLGLYQGNRYGAIGMSRRNDLMYKPMMFKSLADVVMDFEKAYKKYWHDVKKVKVGLPCPHDPHSYECLQWKTLSLNINKHSLKSMSKDLEQHAKLMRSKATSWMVTANPSKKMPTFVDIPKDSIKTKMSRSHSVGGERVLEDVSDEKVLAKTSCTQVYQIRI